VGGMLTHHSQGDDSRFRLVSRTHDTDRAWYDMDRVFALASGGAVQRPGVVLVDVLRQLAAKFQQEYHVHCGCSRLPCGSRSSLASSTSRTSCIVSSWHSALARQRSAPPELLSAAVCWMFLASLVLPFSLSAQVDFVACV